MARKGRIVCLRRDMIVNKKLSPSKKSVDEIAREVIHGDWGNGTERKNRISAAGYDYSAVQKRVNELLR